jgi:hypothetical protein
MTSPPGSSSPPETAEVSPLRRLSSAVSCGCELNERSAEQEVSVCQKVTQENNREHSPLSER